MNNNILRKRFILKAGSTKIELGQKTAIMGIINATPDSFSKDGCYTDSKTITRAVRQAVRFVKSGAALIDIGGESTRPGARRISEKEEIKRVVPVIKKITHSINIPISVDTYKPTVAKAALDEGAVIVNNIMGVKSDKTLLRMIKNYDAAVVLMHIKGTPRTMQKHIKYKDLIKEIVDALKKSIENCLEIGIKSDRIIIDPGIGFGKTTEHNLEILNQLSCFKTLNKPLLVGASRKSFIGNVLKNDVQKRINGSLAAACASIMNGAHIVRVHDVKETYESASIIDAILHPELTKVSTP